MANSTDDDSDSILVICRINGADSILTMDQCNAAGGIIMGPAGGAIAPTSPAPPTVVAQTTPSEEAAEPQESPKADEAVG